MKTFLRSSCLAFFTIALPFNSLLAEIESPERLSEIPSDETKPYQVVIIGGGIGALTSALYLARAGVEPLVIEGSTPGGLLTQSHSVQNWPGELEIEGAQLTERVRKQAEHNGALFRKEEVIGVDFSKRPFTITTRDLHDKEKTQEIQADACIIAMGTQPNFLGIPGETGTDGYWGRGVTNCAICDGNLYRGLKVGVVGGGDAAILEALYLSNIAKEVHVFVRKNTLRAFEEKRIQTLLAKTNVTMHYNTTVEAVRGDGQMVTHVEIKTDLKKKPVDFPLDGLFLAIGSTPNTSLFKGILKLDEKGYILLGKDQMTSIDGVYAIGDIVDPVYKQAISAAGDGAKAALQAQQYISDRENGLASKVKKQNQPVANNQPVAKNEPFSAGGLGQEQTAARAEVIEIYSQEQFDQELQSGIPIVVDFYATWCGPCKMISPLIESSASQLSGKVKFLKVNVDKNFEISNSYDVRAMPTVLLLNSEGTVVDRKVGADQIANLLKQLRNQKPQ